MRPGDDGGGKFSRVLDGEAANGGVGAAATVKFSKRAAGCLSGTYSEGEGSLLSALAFSYMRSLDSLQQVSGST